MIKMLKHTVGQRTIKIGNNCNKETEEIKILRENKKIASKEYQFALRHEREHIPRRLEQYIEAQKELKLELEKNNKKNTKKLLENMIKEGKLNHRNFWKLKSDTEKSKEREPYDTITEDNIQLKDEQETKEYIANYFENLYQARPSVPEYQHKTNDIENKVKEIENEMRNKPTVNEITLEELNDAIKRLKRKKATGPDEIPNEVFIEANQETKNIFIKAFNKVNEEMIIPEEWQKGEICRIYKGKGTKGKCSNERGITLSSNFGKLYERIINERIIGKVNISEAQAGGKRGCATVDHLLLIKELIKAAKKDKKNVYLTYLDVAKAYDKAWLTGIMYVMYKEGLTDNHWTIVKRLNENLTAQLQTKYGLTREIKIKDSIRQGGVLSTTMYGLLMDEISKNVQQKDKGIKINELNEKKGSLLWVDDVLLITTSGKELQESLDITDDTSKTYHVEYGQVKSNTQIIGRKTKANKKESFKLGDIPLENTDKYKYLGYFQNSRNNNEDHMKYIKGKAEGAFQKMNALTGNSNFSMIEMETIWKVVETCIAPIITYGGEIWESDPATYKPANVIYEGILKRILKVPTSTPREAIYIETGLLDPETIIKKNRISMESRIIKGTNLTMKELINMKDEGSWAEQNKKLKEEIRIEDSDINGSEYHLKNTIQKRMKRNLEDKLKASAETKSKMKYYMDGKQTWKVGERAKYISKLTRNQVSTIFKARTRMLKIKSNYKNGYKDLKCRICNNEEESQKHVMEDCVILNAEFKVITKDMIFEEDVNKLREVAKLIEDRMNKMESYNN